MYIDKYVFDPTAVLILLGIKIGLRIAWFLSAVLLLIGNAVSFTTSVILRKLENYFTYFVLQREFRKFLNVWKYLTVSRIVFTIGTSIYALVKFMVSSSYLILSNEPFNSLN